MKKCLLSLSLILPVLSQAQSSMFGGTSNISIQNVSLAASNVSPLNFTYSNIGQLLSAKSLDVPSPTGAIKLDICTNNLGWQVYARVSYNGTPGPAPANWIKKIWISDNSHTVQNLALQTNLTEANQLLFTQPTSGNFSFYYNLKLNPVTSFVAPGVYNYTIHYTMTRP